MVVASYPRANHSLLILPGRQFSNSSWKNARCLSSQTLHVTISSSTVKKTPLARKQSIFFRKGPEVSADTSGQLWFTNRPLPATRGQGPIGFFPPTVFFADLSGLLFFGSMSGYGPRGWSAG